MLFVTHHTKGPEGWAQFRMAPITSRAWDETDRQWIDWMQRHDSTVVTVGHDMYEIVSPDA